MNRRREVPADLARSLRRAVRLEKAADGYDQRRRAIAGTSALLLAAANAGWRPGELADAAGLQAPAVRARIHVARKRHGGHAVGVDVPAPPQPPAPPPELPLHQREWLRSREALALTGVCSKTLTNWRRAQLLPTTRRVGRHHGYALTDLLRVMSAPRRGRVGVCRSAVLAAIRADSIPGSGSFSGETDARETRRVDAVRIGH